MTTQQKLSGYALWAVFWTVFAYHLFQFIAMWLIRGHLQIDEESARFLWGFMLDPDHAAYMASVGFIELLIGWLCLRQLSHKGIAGAVLQQGEYGLVQIIVAVAGAVYLPGVLHAVVMPLSQAIFGQAEAVFREGAVSSFPRHQLLGFFLAGVMIAPVIEEFLFRGVLVSTLQARGWGAVPVVLMSSAGFALLHSQYTFTGLVLVGCIGAFLCILRLWSGGLILPIAAHFTNNLVALLVYLSETQS
jgi:membrane protease YdiL (CAAX protease family)